MFFKRFDANEMSRAFLIIGCLLLSVPVSAVIKPFFPYYNFNLGSKSLSMANAFTAVADDLSAVFWNPAGLAGFGKPAASVSYRADALSYSAGGQDDFANGVAGSWNEDLESASKRIDFLSIAVPVLFWNIKWNFALSYYHYIPYDFEGSHELEFTGFTEPTGTSEFTELISGSGGVDILGFSLAVFLSKYFSVGITLQHFFNSGRIRSDVQSADSAFKQEFFEKLQGMNLIIGCLLKLDKNLQIGFTYHSGMEDVFTSEYRYVNTLDEEAVQDSCRSNIVIPAHYSVGLSVRPVQKWLLVYDFSKILWSSGRISNYYGNPDELPFPVRDDYEMNQKNIVNHRLGTEISVIMSKTVFFIRGGLFWERQLFVGANDEMVWLKGFSLGLGIRLFSNLNVDLAYMNQHSGWKEPGYFSPDFFVDTHFRNHIFSISASYLFPTSGN
jgi:hypothetical protein